MIPLAKPVLGADEEAAVLETLRTGQIGPGPRVRAFEKAFADAHEAAHGVACTNGTVALELALRGLGVGPGDEVVVPAFTFVATANAVLSVGAKPVFADIEPAHFTLDPSDVAEVVSPRTKAIIPVHLYGHPADVRALRESQPRVPIVEDAAQAHAAETANRRVGAIGNAGCFSFYPTKNMTTGEGGMVLTDDAALADRVRSLANHGRLPQAALGTYDHVEWGTNYRMTDLSAAIGLVQLLKLEEWTEKRRENAARLSRELGSILATPGERRGVRHVYHQYTVRVSSRDRVLEAVRKEGVSCGVYYPKVLYQYEHLRTFGRRCPEAERAVTEVLSLPVHPSLSEGELRQVSAAVSLAVRP